MKKFLLLTAAAIIAVGFSSCKKDKDDDKASIVGAWAFSSIEIKNIVASPQSFKDEIQAMVEAELQDFRSSLPGTIFLFNEDGTGAEPAGDVFAYTYSGGILSLIYHKGTDSEYAAQCPAVVTKNTLTMQYPLEQLNIDIDEGNLPDGCSFTSCTIDMIFTR